MKKQGASLRIIEYSINYVSRRHKQKAAADFSVTAFVYAETQPILLGFTLMPGPIVAARTQLLMY